MNEDEWLGLAYDEMFAGYARREAEGLAYEHRVGDQPAHTALLHRTQLGYPEVTWIQAYPAIRLIVVTQPQVIVRPGHTLPGVVRELPIGWRDMASPEALRTRFEKVVESYLGMGWVRKPIEVRTEGR